MPDPVPPPPPTGPAPTFRIEGALVISNVEACRAQLQARFTQAPEIAIDLGAATDFDLFGLQLLWAARLSAETAGKPFHLTNVPAALARACDLAGLAPAALAPLPAKLS